MNKLDEILVAADSVVNDARWQPWHGWHNERLVPDNAACQQDRREFRNLLFMLVQHKCIDGSCLQLGLGPSGASHIVWQQAFSRVVTIDGRISLMDNDAWPGMDTHSREGVAFAMAHEPAGGYDFLFIDAGHSFFDVMRDFIDYSPMVRSGGIVAFHDALERNGYPEVKVHEFIKQLPIAAVFGTEVGTAYMVKE